MTTSTSETAHNEDRLIKIAEVVEITGFGKSMLYRWMREGTFPKPCKPGGAGSRWSLFEVRAWRAARLAERDAA